MGVECYECNICYKNGVHEDLITNCETCDSNICNKCIDISRNLLSYKDELLIKCPKCDELNEVKKLRNMIDVLLDLYNRRRKKKITFEYLSNTLIL